MRQAIYAANYVRSWPGSARPPTRSNCRISWMLGPSPSTDEGGLCALDKGVHDLFVAGMLKVDRQFVVLDKANDAIAELLVKHPVADRKPAHFFDLLAAQRHPRALDHQWLAQILRRLPVVPVGAPAG